MPDSFLDRLKQAAQKIPGLRPASINGEKMTEAEYRLQMAIHNLSNKVKEKAPGLVQQAQQADKSLEQTRDNTYKRYENHWSPFGMDQYGLPSSFPGKYQAQQVLNQKVFNPMREMVSAQDAAKAASAPAEPTIELDEAPATPAAPVMPPTAEQVRAQAIEAARRKLQSGN